MEQVQLAFFRELYADVDDPKVQMFLRDTGEINGRAIVQFQVDKDGLSEIGLLVDHDGHLLEFA